jgi:hypothetical protein
MEHLSAAFTSSRRNAHKSQISGNFRDASAWAFWDREVCSGLGAKRTFPVARSVGEFARSCRPSSSRIRREW